MGWRDAQAKVDAGAYKPKSDAFGEFATGFANVFVPTYTKMQEEKRAEERKKREEEAKRAAAAAAAARAENKKEKERQEQTDFILLQLGFSDPSEASDNIREQVYKGVVNIGASSTADMLLKRYPKGLPDSAYATNKAPEPVAPPVEAQTDDILTTDTTPGSVGTNVITDTAQEQPTLDNVAEESSIQPSTSADTSTTEAASVGDTDAQSFSLFGPQPSKIDLNDFIGKDTTFIDDWVKINGKDYSQDQLSLLDEYRSIQAEREDDALWWRDPQKLDKMSETGLQIAMNGLDTNSEEYKAINYALGIKTEGVKFDSLIGKDPDAFKQFRTIYGEQMKEQGNLTTFDELEKIAIAKDKDEQWWRDPRQVDNLSDNGLAFAIQSASTPEEKSALEAAQKTRVEGLDIDSLRGKSVAEFDQYAEQYGDRLESEGLLDTFQRMRSIQEEVEKGNVTEKTINAKDIFLRSRMESAEYLAADTALRGQMMVQFEKEWAEGTRVASNETYTQANFDADFIKYTEVLNDVALGNGAKYSDAEIGEARKWITVTKPIAEERLNAGSNRSINNKIDMLVNDLGVDREMAKKIALGLIDVRVDPVTREAFTFDISTGERVGQVSSPTQTSTTSIISIAPDDFDMSTLSEEERIVLASLPEEERQKLFTQMDGFAKQLSSIDPTKPMGILGAVRRGFNRFGAVTGLGEFSPDTATAAGAIDMLAVLTETTLQSAFPETRDSVYLKTRLRTLAPKYGVGQSAEGALKTTRNMITFLDDSLGTLNKIASGEIEVAPSAQSEARVKLEEIRKLRGYYQGLEQALVSETAQPSGADYLGNAIPEPPTTKEETPAPAQGTEANPYITTATTDPASIPSGAYYRDPNGVLRQKQ